MSARVAVHCKLCNSPVERNEHNLKKTKGVAFCSLPKRCRYEYRLKQRDPKAYFILENTNKGDFYYLLGLICTDGNINYPREDTTAKTKICYSCHISLNKKDRYLFERIRSVFGGRIYDGRTDNTVEWFITHKQFVEYLKDIVGLTHNKSKTLDICKFFKTIPDNLKRDFLRGVIDGDGSVKQYNFHRIFSICSGSRNFIEMLRQYFVEHYKVAPTFQNLKGCFYIVLTGRNMLPILNDVYQNVNTTTLFLDRKYQTFCDIQKHYYSTYGENVTLNLEQRLPSYASLNSSKVTS